MTAERETGKEQTPATTTRQREQTPSHRGGSISGKPTREGSSLESTLHGTLAGS